jgi:hypothetical protein
VHVREHTAVLLDHSQKPRISHGFSQGCSGRIKSFRFLVLTSALVDYRLAIERVRFRADRAGVASRIEALAVAPESCFGLTALPQQGSFPTQDIGDHWVCGACTKGAQGVIEQPERPGAVSRFLR